MILYKKMTHRAYFALLSILLSFLLLSCMKTSDQPNQKGDGFVLPPLDSSKALAIDISSKTRLDLSLVKPSIIVSDTQRGSTFTFETPDEQKKYREGFIIAASTPNAKMNIPTLEADNSRKNVCLVLYGVDQTRISTPTCGESGDINLSGKIDYTTKDPNLSKVTSIVYIGDSVESAQSYFPAPYITNSFISH